MAALLRLYVRCTGARARNFGGERAEKMWKRSFSTQSTLSGMAALITGASGGIGQEIAKEFVKNGAQVAVASRSIKELEKLVRGFDTGNRHIALSCDVSDPISVRDTIKAARNELGSLSCVVNASAISKDTPLMVTNSEDMKSALETNLLGAMYITKEAGRIIAKQRKGGSILHIGSVVGLDGNQGQVAYAASKSGLIGLCKTASKELGSADVRVNVIAPGFISTGMTTHLDEERIQQVLARTALRRLGSASDVAKLAVFLSGAGGKYITGQVIRVDGGLHL
ncbi:hypothetical protein AAMO2058_000578100 [Amorphochlora amoebiformis]